MTIGKGARPGRASATRKRSLADVDGDRRQRSRAVGNLAGTSTQGNYRQATGAAASPRGELELGDVTGEAINLGNLGKSVPGGGGIGGREQRREAWLLRGVRTG